MIANLKSKSHLLLTASAVAFCACTTTSTRADTFGTGANAFNIDFVPVGNAGNTDDAGTPGGNEVEPTGPYGGVAYAYRMGVTETAKDWMTKATNLGMTNTFGGQWAGSQPATPSWYGAAAFVNWLNTSTGHQAAYQLNLSNTAMTLWSSVDAWQLGGENRYRHKDAYYFLPSEDEWYKAAFYSGSGTIYYDYATGSDTIPTAVASGTNAGTVVYNQLVQVPANVDANGGLSAYGTMGQNGNVWEWQESAYDGVNNSPSESRALRGGSWFSYEPQLRHEVRDMNGPSNGNTNIGFRVASVATVPEPTSTMLLLVGGALLPLRWRR